MKIYAVYKNSDMTEGRGPMVLDSLFLDRDNAIKYFNTKPGVMGRSPVYTNSVTGKEYKGWLDWEYRGEWDLVEMETAD